VGELLVVISAVAGMVIGMVAGAVLYRSWVMSDLDRLEDWFIELRNQRDRARELALDELAKLDRMDK
jgi:hypothetical protein